MSAYEFSDQRLHPTDDPLAGPDFEIRPELDLDLQQLLLDMRRYRSFMAAVKWCKWALVPSKSHTENARHLKHLAEWDFNLNREIDHATFQAAMSKAGYQGTPTGREDCNYHVGLSADYRRTHRNDKLVHDHPWGDAWLADALKPGRPAS